MRGLTDGRVLVSGLLSGALLACAVFLPQAAGARWLFVIAAPLPLLNNLGDVRAALLQARGWVARSQWPKFILGPALMLGVLTGLWLWQGRLYPVELVAALTVAALVPILVNQLQFRRAAPRTSTESLPSTRVKAALPFMWL